MQSAPVAMRTLLRTAVAALAVFTACGGGAVGSTFAGETQLLTSLGGGQVVGRFDVQFPAEVTAIDRCRKEVEFSHVKVDVCPDCRGMWLDAGEIDMIGRTSENATGGFIRDLFKGLRSK